MEAIKLDDYITRVISVIKLYGADELRISYHKESEHNWSTEPIVITLEIWEPIYDPLFVNGSIELWIDNEDDGMSAYKRIISETGIHEK